MLMGPEAMVLSAPSWLMTLHGFNTIKYQETTVFTAQQRYFILSNGILREDQIPMWVNTTRNLGQVLIRIEVSC